LRIEIVDTVYIIAYLRPSDPLHHVAKKVIESLGNQRKVSQAALIELDLLMKSRGLTTVERLKTWTLLGAIIPAEGIEVLTPDDFAMATVLIENHMLDYFDSLVAAQCIIRGARPLTTDEDILDVISKTTREELLERIRRYSGGPSKSR